MISEMKSAMIENFFKKNQEHLEVGQAFVRAGSAMIFALYSVALHAFGFGAEAREFIVVIIVYLVFTLSQLLFTRHYPDFSFWRCLCNAVLDLFFVSMLIAKSGMIGTPFLFTPAIVSIGYGLRHGIKFGYFSSVANLVFVSGAIYFSPFWQGLPMIAIGVILTSCLVPVYAVSLTRQLSIGKKQMASRAERFEKAADDSNERLRIRHGELAHVAKVSLLGEMTSGIAHEINQPLSAILSYNQACIRMLRSGQSNSDEIIRVMTMAGEQTKRASQIVERFRAVVKKKPIDQIPTDINQTILNAIRHFEQESHRLMLTIVTNLDQMSPYVQGDGIQLEQVIVNLFRNASDAMSALAPNERSIAVSTFSADGKVAVTVADNGHGISSDIFPNLFTPFFTTKAEGMGLGLVICQSIIEALGGTLVVRNGPDRGAVFCFTLPACQRAGA
ncbi:sensor histidine kinase [Actimicrobium antarcticum]|uniref:histidine kinase n=1 Tax=Actimicrobium antarcticum TaxID=1051899 RepID=A0ABP7TKT9_9BURK